MIVGYSDNYVFDFSNVVSQSLIYVRSFKMYSHALLVPSIWLTEMKCIKL